MTTYPSRRATRSSPTEIGQDIAEAGAMIGEERLAVARAAAQAIRDERRGAVWLTKGEARAVLDAISEMTDGNARDFAEWNRQTHRPHSVWRALLRAEAKIVEVIR